MREAMMGALPKPLLPHRIKEILHRQKERLLKARAVIRRQTEELESLKALLARRLGLERGVVVEVSAMEVDCPQPLDADILMALPAARRITQA